MSLDVLDGPFVVASGTGAPVSRRVATGTSNQVTVTDNGAGSTLVFSLPQSIHTAATPTFASLTLSGLTLGSVPYVGAAGVVSQDNGNFFYDGTLHNLGLGLTAPLAPLHISRAVSGYSAFTPALGTAINAGSIVATSIDDASFAGGATTFNALHAQVSSNPAADATRTVRALNAQAIIPSSNAIALAGYTLQAFGARADYAGTNSLLTVRGGSITVAGAGAGSVTTVNALSLTAAQSGAGAATTVNALELIARRTVTTGTGGVTTLSGLTVALDNANASGTVPLAVGIDIKDLVNASTITETYGLRIGDLSTGTQTNTPYSIITTDYNARNLFKGIKTEFYFGSDASTNYILMQAVNIPAVGSYGGAELNQMSMRVVARVDSATKYANPSISGYYNNTAAGTPLIFLGDIGWEGLYSDAGALTLSHFYIWDNINLRGMFEFSHSAWSPARHPDSGLSITGVSDKVFTSTPPHTVKPLVKNDGVTATYCSLEVKPTFNTGASNTTTTFNVLDLDTLNTSVTGLTVNLAKFSYGGSARFSVASHGGVVITTEAGSNVGLTTYNNGAGGAIYQSSKFRGTAAAPFRAQGGDTLGGMNYFGGQNDTSDSTAGATLSSTAAQFMVKTVETFTSTARGTRFAFSTVDILGTSLVVRMNIDMRGVRIGTTTGLADRSGTQGTNQLEIYNGTAPVGTLTNGVALYGASGYLKLLDAAGLDGHVLAGSAVNTVSPTSPNRTITVNIGGTTLYLAAKTTND